MRQRERENLIAALGESNWKVMGSGGAAELLGIKAYHLVLANEEDGAGASRALGLGRADSRFHGGEDPGTGMRRDRWQSHLTPLSAVLGVRTRMNIVFLLRRRP